MSAVHHVSIILPVPLPDRRPGLGRRLCPGAKNGFEKWMGWAFGAFGGEGRSDLGFCGFAVEAIQG